MLMPAVLPVTAKHGKRLREEPIAQLYEQGRVIMSANGLCWSSRW
ncbi:hypothetical protein [Streptomyces luteogriseus]